MKTKSLLSLTFFFLLFSISSFSLSWLNYPLNTGSSSCSNCTGGDGNYSQFTNITNLQINNTQLDTSKGFLEITMNWLLSLFYTKEEINDTVTSLNNSINSKSTVPSTSCNPLTEVLQNLVNTDGTVTGVCVTKGSSGGGSGSKSSTTMLLQNNYENTNIYNSDDRKSSTTFINLINNDYISNTSDLNITGNLNVTGNVYVAGCIIFNMTGTPVTLGDCI